MNLIENDKSSEYPIFIWVDKNIFNWENRIYCEQLQNDYQNLFQAFDNISDALKILHKI